MFEFGKVTIRVFFVCNFRFILFSKIHFFLIRRRAVYFVFQNKMFFWVSGSDFRKDFRGYFKLASLVCFSFYFVVNLFESDSPGSGFSELFFCDQLYGRYSFLFLEFQETILSSYINYQPIALGWYHRIKVSVQNYNFPSWLSLFWLNEKLHL